MGSAVFTYRASPPQLTVWEEALGLEGSSGLTRIDRVLDGLPVTAFYRFSEASGVSHAKLASAIGISIRTVQRRSESGGSLAAGQPERLVRLADLYSRASETIGSDALARHWMQTPRKTFGGRTPSELAGSELGAREVENLLLRIEDGIFS